MNVATAKAYDGLQSTRNYSEIIKLLSGKHDTWDDVAELLKLTCNYPDDEHECINFEELAGEIVIDVLTKRRREN